VLLGTCEEGNFLNGSFALPSFCMPTMAVKRWRKLFPPAKAPLFSADSAPREASEGKGGESVRVDDDGGDDDDPSFVSVGADFANLSLPTTTTTTTTTSTSNEGRDGSNLHI